MALRSCRPSEVPPDKSLFCIHHHPRSWFSPELNHATHRKGLLLASSFFSSLGVMHCGSEYPPFPLPLPFSLPPSPSPFPILHHIAQDTHPPPSPPTNAVSGEVCEEPVLSRPSGVVYEKVLWARGRDRSVKGVGVIVSFSVTHFIRASAHPPSLPTSSLHIYLPCSVSSSSTSRPSTRTRPTARNLRPMT